ncbi:Gfo/Idh/MocA family protein [Cerasicoccus maritimus]|uniref:Gfo/Idh/MocA family protein n=1 Tax=Cerasicoccus maritimus TaxID=490089 RepID=UPI0028529B40|nr:Gfo/Idh/MocA family oxidoreductase [Cerasicoccus maritimus]
MIKVAVIGTGGMAKNHALKLSQKDKSKVVACCDISAERVAEFAKTYNIPETYTDLSEMLEKCDFDAISIVTPDAFHAPIALQALAAGKHVLSEKPLATSVEDAEKMVAAAKKAGVINMVNFSYRDSSAIQRAAKMVQGGELGRIFHVEAHYLQSWLTAKDWGDWATSPGWLWRCSTEHGSNGVLGDVGVHILDFATFPVGDAASLQARLHTFDKAPGNQIGEYKLDANDSALMIVEFASGAMGTVTTTRMATGHMNSLALSIHGEKGALRIDLDKSYHMIETSRIGADGKTEPWESHYCPPTPNIYERFIESIASGVQDQPDFARGLAVQKMLDAATESNQSKQPVQL